MAIFKEVVRGDGSGIAEYYRVQDGKVMNVDYSMVTNKPTLNGVTLSGDLTMEDFGMDIDGVVETLTGEEISHLKKDDNKIVLCTTDYTYTDEDNRTISLERGSVYEIYQGMVVDKIPIGDSGITDTKVTTIDNTVTDDQYPSALAVKNYVDNAIGSALGGSY